MVNLLADIELPRVLSYQHAQNPRVSLHSLNSKIQRNKHLNISLSIVFATYRGNVYYQTGNR